MLSDSLHPMANPFLLIIPVYVLLICPSPSACLLHGRDFQVLASPQLSEFSCSESLHSPLLSGFSLQTGIRWSCLMRKSYSSPALLSILTASCHQLEPTLFISSSSTLHQCSCLGLASTAAVTKEDWHKECCQAPGVCPARC